MNITKWIAIILLAAALVPVGCGKSNSGQNPPGVSIDLPKLRDSFTAASPDLQTLSGEAVRNIRFGNYPAALVSLEKLANAPGLTDAQKKVVTDVTAQVKQSASNTPAPPAQ
jgi:hypothetical protein